MCPKVDLVNQSAAEASLSELMHEVMHRYRAVMQDAIAADESGLAVMEARALGFVVSHPGATASDLVKRSGRDKAQVARLVGELVERGLLERAPGPDRRTHALRATAEGRAVQRRLERKWRAATSALFAPLSADECARLAGLLARLVEGGDAGEVEP